MSEVSSIEPKGRLGIVGVVRDIPNAITFLGAVSAMLACVLAIKGHYNFAIICVLWSHLADSLDGLVARNMSGRAPGMGDVGKAMDALGDFLSSGLFPLVLLASMSGGTPFPIVAGLLVCAAGILRLSYFEAFGLPGGTFVGVPLPHNIIVFSLVYYLGTQFGADRLPEILGVAALIMSALHLSAIRFPKMTVKWIAASAVYIAGMTALLAF